MFVYINTVFLLILFLGVDKIIAAEQKKSGVQDFLDFIQSGNEVATIPCQVCEVIKKELCPQSRNEDYDLLLLGFSLTTLQKHYSECKEVLDKKLQDECLRLTRRSRAEQRNDRAALLKEENEYLSKGGSSQDSDAIKIKNMYPLLSQIIDIYNYSYDAYTDLKKYEVIDTVSDFVSICKYLETKTFQPGRSLEKFAFVPNSRHAYLVRTILEIFPKRTDLLIQQAKITKKVLSEKREYSKMEALEFEALRSKIENSKILFLEKEKKRQKKVEKQFFKNVFLGWMLPVKMRLGQRKLAENMESSTNRLYVKNVWHRWLEGIIMQKQQLFEQTVMEPNQKHFERLELIRNSKDGLKDIFEQESSDAMITVESTKDSVVEENLKNAKELTLLEKRQRRDYRKSIIAMSDANKKHQQLVCLKKIARQQVELDDQEILRNYFSLWKNRYQHQDNSLAEQAAARDPQENLVSLQEPMQVGAQIVTFRQHNPYRPLVWQHNPYSAYVF